MASFVLLLSTQWSDFQTKSRLKFRRYWGKRFQLFFFFFFFGGVEGSVIFQPIIHGLLQTNLLLLDGLFYIGQLDPVGRLCDLTFYICRISI